MPVDAALPSRPLAEAPASSLVASFSAGDLHSLAPAVDRRGAAGEARPRPHLLSPNGVEVAFHEALNANAAAAAAGSASARSLTPPSTAKGSPPPVPLSQGKHKPLERSKSDGFNVTVNVSSTSSSEGDDDITNAVDDNAEEETEEEEAARQVAQLVNIFRIASRLIAVVAVVVAVVSSIAETRVSTQIAGVSFWKWSIVCAVIFGSTYVSSLGLDLLHKLVDRRAALMKRIAFGLTTLEDELAATISLLVVVSCWHFLLQADAKENGWGDIQVILGKVLCAFLACAVTLLISAALAATTARYFQRESNFDLVMDCLLEDFALQTLLNFAAALGKQRRIKTARLLHGESVGGELEDQISPTGSAFSLTATARDQFAKSLRDHAGIVKAIKSMGLPIKEEVVLKKREQLRPGDLSQARLERITAHISKHPIALPSAFVDEARAQWQGTNTTVGRVRRASLLWKQMSFGNFEGPVQESERSAAECHVNLLAQHDSINHISVAHACGTRLVALLREVMPAAKLDARLLTIEGLTNAGLSHEVSTKVMETLGTSNVEKPETVGVNDVDIGMNGRQIVQRVRQVFMRRRDAQHTLMSMNSVLQTLRMVQLSILSFVLVFIELAIFDVNVLELWFTVSSLILAFAFMFGNIIRQVFESIIFLFISRPFEVGDVLLIDGERHTVKRIALLRNTFERWNGEMTLISNCALTEKTIVNLTRSKTWTDCLVYSLDLDTPLVLLKRLNEELKKHVAANSANLSFAGTRLYPGDGLKLTVKVWYTHTHNTVDLGRTGDTRDKLTCFVTEFWRRERVSYHVPAVRVEMLGSGGGGGL